MKIICCFTLITRNLFKQSLLLPLLFSIFSVNTGLQAAELVGTMDGKFAVQNGAATYSIPIQVPVGVAGMQPSLSLNYNSQGGNGLLGIGWSLGGLSAIYRCPQTKVQDGKIHGVDYTAEDRFCLDGQRLVAIGGNYGANHTEYRTEIDGYSKIISHGSQGSGPSYWMVKAKSGQTMEFGNSAGSKIRAQGKNEVATWAINAISDAVGNSMSFIYYNDGFATGEHYPIRIDYAGNNAIEFKYEPRSDSRDKYYMGSSSRLTQRIKTLTTKANGISVLSININYDDNNIASLSKLVKVEECDAAGSCLPATNFSWQAEENNGFSGFRNASNNYGSSWGAAQHYSTISYPELNGDGLPDICGRGSSGIYCGRNNGNGFDPYTRWASNYGAGGWSTAQHYSTIRYLDINGDGLTDICARASAGIYCGLGTGTKFNNFKYWTSKYGVSWSAAQHYSTIQYTDINGDGLPDICGRAANGIACGINNGDGFNTIEMWTGHFGSSWGATEHYSTIQYRDLNGDGLVDVCGRASSGIVCGLNNGDGFDSHTFWTSAYGLGWSAAEHYSTIRLLDVSGDGRIDICGRSASGIYCSDVNNQNRRGIGNRVVTISSESGVRTDIDYAPLTWDTIYSKEAPPKPYYPDLPLQMAQYVVVKASSSDSNSIISSATYKYAGLKMNLLGRGSLGYAQIETTNEQTGITTKTEYRQDFPYIGMVKRSETRASDGALLSEVNVEYDELLTHNNSVRSIYTTKRTESSHKRNDDLIKTVVTEQSDFDAYGNIGQIKVTTISADNSEVYIKTTNSIYDNDAAKWHLGRLRDATAIHQHANGTITSRTSAFTYYNDSGLLKTETIEPNNPALWQTTTTEYDTFGNKQKITITGAGILPRSTTTQYDNEGRFPLWTENALGHRESYIYNPVCGKVESLTGPNGLTTTWTYDSLCRKLSETRADGTTTTWDRAWADPYAVANAHYSLTTTSSGKPPSSVYYDTLGREIRKESVGFDGTPVYQETLYNDLGQVWKKSLPYFQGNTAYWIETIYDDLGRPEVVIQPDDAGSAATTYTYDGLTVTESNALGQNKVTTKNVLGKVVQVVEEEGGWVTYQYDPIGNLLQTNANGVITQMHYDVRGNKTSMDDPNMGHWAYRYNALGKLVWQQDAKGQTVDMSFDLLGRMVKRVEPEGTTDWFYDSAANGVGKLAKVQAPMGYQKIYSYDALGRPSVTTTHADNQSHSISTQYDNLGRVWKVTRPQGFVVENVYSNLGFLKAKRSPSSQVDDYDASHISFLLNTAINDATSALASATDYANSAQYYSDTADYYRTLTGSATLDPALTAQLQSSAATLDAAADLLVEQMDSYIQLAEELLDIAEQLAAREEILLQRNAYSGSIDTTGDYQDLLNDGSQVVFWQARSRDASGRLTSEMAGNGLLTERVYNQATGHLDSIMSGFGYATKIRNLEYQYDSLNNVTSRQDHVQGLSENFQYDRLNRLTKSYVSGSIGGTSYDQTINYDYDAWGNIINKSDLGYYSYVYGDVTRNTGNAGPHALVSAGGTHTGYQYDNNGNMLQGAGRSINWSSFNKPTRFEKAGQISTFAYGPDRARYLKIANTSRTLYIGKAYERISTGDSVKHKHFIYAGGQLVAIHIKSETSGVTGVDKTRYLHRDSLGSIDTITDGQGRIVDRMSYDPFGKRRAGDWRAANDPILPVLTNRGFTGHEHVDEMRLIHMNGRVYDPELGRFLSADPNAANLRVFSMVKRREN